MDRLIEWLETEQALATSEWTRASLEVAQMSLNLADRELSQYQRDYWAGYLNAITNTLNQLTGMGE